MGLKDAFIVAEAGPFRVIPGGRKPGEPKTAPGLSPHDVSTDQRAKSLEDHKRDVLWEMDEVVEAITMMKKQLEGLPVEKLDMFIPEIIEKLKDGVNNIEYTAQKIEDEQ